MFPERCLLGQPSWRDFGAGQASYVRVLWAVRRSHDPVRKI
jgi:hypothetical protein